MTIFEPDVVSAVLAHMNGDHNDDNLLIAQAFGRPDADTATMHSLDGDGGTWVYQVGEQTGRVTVPWSEPIGERQEIRREIVVLYDEACARLGLEPRPHT